MNATDLTLDDLDRMIDYNPETGKARWTKSLMVSPRQRDKPIKTEHPDGYYRVTIQGRHYPLHRLLWWIYYGQYPRSQIWHRNGAKTDNRIDNLAEARNALAPLQPRERFRVPDKPPWE